MVAIRHLPHSPPCTVGESARPHFGQTELADESDIDVCTRGDYPGFGKAKRMFLQSTGSTAAILVNLTVIVLKALL
jgi:hypothetical protein